MVWRISTVVGGASVVAVLAVACAAGEGNGGEGGETATGTGPGGGQGGAGGSGLASGGTAGAGGASGGAGAVGGSGGSGTAGGGAVGGSGGGTGGCVIASYSFDGCGGGWTHGGRNDDWRCGNVTSGPNDDHTGDHFAWGTNLSGDAAMCQDSWLQSPTLDLSAYGGASLRLAFWHWYDFRECTCGSACLATPDESDSGGMIKVDSGAGLTLVAPLGGYEHGGAHVNCAAAGYCGESPCEVDEEASAFTAAGVEQWWHQSTVDISAHATSSFEVRFLFGSHDGVSCFPNSPGWYIDDVLIYTEQACP